MPSDRAAIGNSQSNGQAKYRGIDGASNGSGVILAKNGGGYVVLTNQHVVEASEDYQVTTADGRSYPVTDVRELQGSDLALVYFNSDRQYTIVARGNSATLVERQARTSDRLVEGKKSKLKSIAEQNFSFVELQCFLFGSKFSDSILM